VREGRALCVVIFWSGNLCGVQMSLTLVFSDDLSHSSTFIHIERGRGGLVTVDPCGQGTPPALRKMVALGLWE
jgi:hypothetical protein